MHSRKRQGVHPTQAGFSMVEMLMAAFILSIGILGIAMLQTMSLKASRGSQSLTTALHIADRIMDEVELEGRLGWLNVTDTKRLAPGALPNLKYLRPGAILDQQFNVDGQNINDAGITDTTQFYTVTTTKTDIQAGATGDITDVTVTIEFADQVDATKAAIKRTATLTRRFIHG
jgi:prepilin-type N-terminal cleavage/methylation domain-containing protein